KPARERFNEIDAYYAAKGNNKKGRELRHNKKRALQEPQHLRLFRGHNTLIRRLPATKARQRVY
ncbi:MAG TPA: hypothetical protein VJ933_08030, partial [Phaeodactylibacter sp.]|nr:hypothetical protein [Phaeodactylibacter sp.]